MNETELKNPNKMNHKLFLFFLILVTITIVNAFEIVCTKDTRGITLWNHNASFNETGWDLEDIENTEGLNCTLIDENINLTECKHFEPIINQLNQNLRDKTEIIEKQEKLINMQRFYKYFAIVFVITTVALTIMLKINTKEEKNAREESKRSKKTNR